jgi:hypothetical protein
VVNPGGSQDTHGELLRAKRGATPEEDVSDRGKPFSSRGTVEAVSIHGVSRKPTCDGGGVTSGVTGRQRRSRAGSETASGARVSKKHQRPSARVKYPSSSTHGPPKRVQRVVKRRILRSHRSQGRTKQVGNQGRGYRSGR